MTINSEPDKDKSRVAPDRKETFFPEGYVDPIKDRQGNQAEGNDFNNLPEESYQTQQQPDKTQQLYDKAFEILSYKPPKPRFDSKRPEEYARMARSNAIAKGLNLIGDTIALSKNANVNKRQNDNAEAGYTNQIYKYVDDYNRRLDDWDWRNFTNQLRTGQLMLDQANSNRTFDLREKDLAQEQANYIAKLAQSQNEFDRKMALDYAKMINSDMYNGLNYDEKVRHNKQMELASWLRAKRTGTSSNKEPFKLHSASGDTTINLEGNERDRILALILMDTSVADDDIALLKAEMGEGLSTNSMNVLVQKYWEKSDAAKAYLTEKYGYGKQGSSAQSGIKGIDYDTPETSPDLINENQQEEEISTGGYY